MIDTFKYSLELEKPQESDQVFLVYSTRLHHKLYWPI